MSLKQLNIGEKIKSLRERQELTLEQVAQDAAIPVTVLAAIEAQTATPPLGQIVSLANVFNVPIGEILGGSSDSPFCIVRRDEHKTVERFESSTRTSGGYSYESLGHKKQNRHMEPFLVTLTPSGAPHTTPNQHVGEEILFVLEGQVEVSLAGHTDIFNPGDSIYYDSTLPHVVTCHGDQTATLFAVIYARKDMLIF
ncbi:helix-turn-helix domain-containing protein [Geopsychrobacter electrodiphilus]|uniref:helix-turn-helix domain-containing protein n=1 Tax=Geopsychrobacter electrodiphilus TaxID=225196 RepID=UPI00036A1D2F|nr:cupin domain-containing protein [Geopsychrobacter electrodiphilus]